jgi:hypothetical protein
MSVLGCYDSWSKHHATELDLLFYSCLVPIIMIYITSYSGHPKREEYVSKNFQGIKLKHLLMITGYLFLGVVICGVNSSWEWVQILHFIFTISAIITGYITMFSVWRRTPLAAFLYALIGVGGLVVGFTTDLYSLAWGEVIVAFPLALWMFLTIK